MKEEHIREGEMNSGSERFIFLGKNIVMMELKKALVESSVVTQPPILAVVLSPRLSVVYSPAFCGLGTRFWLLNHHHFEELHIIALGDAAVHRRI